MDRRPSAAAPEPQPGVPAAHEGKRRGWLHAFVVEHEERWLFLALYVGLAVTLSLVVTLFWLLVLLAIHGVFEWVRLRATGSPHGRVAQRVVWEVKLDIALILFALALSLYMDQVVGLLGLGAAARVGAATRVGVRAMAWSRGIRAAMLSIDDVAQVGRGLARAGSPRSEKRVAAPRRRRLGAEDWISLSLAAVCVALILAAPWFTGYAYAEIGPRLLEELRPLP